MSDAPRIGFVGFGEAGFHIAAGLREAGLEQITAFDINTDTPGLGEKIRQRAEETGTRLIDSDSELTGASDIVISTVTANQALVAAQQNAPGFTPGSSTLISIPSHRPQTIDRSCDHGDRRAFC